MNTRRDFLKSAAAGLAIAALPHSSQAEAAVRPLCIFSKHLPQTDWARLAQIVKQLGFNGIDLTVRPGGHVPPERAAEDLPKGVEALRAAGVLVPMITTGLTTGSDPTAKPILAAAGKLSIPYFKPGYYKYAFKDVRAELDRAGQDFRTLTEVSKQHGVQCGFHNHDSYLGAPLWDIARVIDGLDPKWVGYYFDVRHAVAEGGAAGWKIAFNLIAPRLKMIAIKDFYWEKTPKGWQIRNCPLGEGMVDWPAYFKLLRGANFTGPISLHVEYEIPGATKAAQEENTLVAAQKDLKFLKAQLQETFSNA